MLCPCRRPAQLELELLTCLFYHHFRNRPISPPPTTQEALVSRHYSTISLEPEWTSTAPIPSAVASVPAWSALLCYQRLYVQSNPWHQLSTSCSRHFSPAFITLFPRLTLIKTPSTGIQAQRLPQLRRLPAPKRQRGGHRAMHLKRLRGPHRYGRPFQVVGR